MAGFPGAPSEQDRFRERLAAAQEKARRGAEGAPAPAETAVDETTPDQATTDETTAPEADEVQEPSGGPVGTGEHVVRQGECISSIAKDTGHFWETIWQDGANAELREVRGDPNVLLPDDRVTVPALRRKQEPGETEMRHRFVRKGEPASFRIRMLVEGEPRGNEPYTVEVDGQPVASGTTASDGLVEFPIPGDAREGILRVGQGEDEQVLNLGFGDLDPVTETSGVQARLRNLGYPCGPIDGILGERTREAIKSFQRDNHLEQTGEPDDAARNRLRQAYGT